MWVRASMRRSYGVLLVFVWCAACAEAPTLASRPPPATAEEKSAPEPASLPVLARSSRPLSPVRILAPLDGSVVDAGTSSGIVIRVQGSSGTPSPNETLVLSLDGARPRPVGGTALGIAELLEPGMTLANGAHDLVLSALGPDGVVLEPSAGGVASVRFFVGGRPNPLPLPRIVCLAPFGTHYGSAPSISLDVVVVGHAGQATAPVDGPALDVAIQGAGVPRRARVAGRGPFALGDFESGDHEITVTSARGAPPALPGRCLFSYNRELERSP